MAAEGSSLVLVDSSIWIDYYHPRGSRTLKVRLQEQLKRGVVATAGLIAVEVLQGAPNASILGTLQEDFLGLQWLDVTQPIWLEAARLGSRLRQAGLNLPATDVIIATVALHYRCRLWHRDTDFTAIAKHTPLAFFRP